MEVLLFLFALLMVVVVASSTASQSNSSIKTKFMECSPTPILCKDPINPTNISYPFREEGMPEYCGHGDPQFQVSCTSQNVPMVAISGKEYLVDYINYDSRFLAVSELAYSYSDSCSSLRSFTNTTIDSRFFNYLPNDINLTMYFNCNVSTMTSSSSSSSRLNNISCLDTPGNHSYYRLPSDDNSSSSSSSAAAAAAAPPQEMCSSIVLIPMYVDNVTPFVEGRVDFLGVLQKGFGLNWMAGVDEWCGGCTHSGGVCGHDSTSPDAQTTCFCPDGRTANATCNIRDLITNVKKKTAIGIVGGIVALVTTCCIVICCYYCVYRKKCQNNDQNVENFLKKHGSLAPKRYKYSDVKKITKSFRDKLGQGGYGTVFKGTLIDGRLVAVKVLGDSKGNGEDFFNEIASIGRSSHVNIVNLLGFCSEGSKRALIYEYMCNGSLDKLICSEEPKTTLRWEKLYQIAIGIARGLEYLHRGCNTRIVHFDIKPHNILLDEDFCPKISDFGLSKLCLRKDSILSSMEGTRGTVGYIAPEVFCRNFGVVSSKSDIYSYGMMVLEMIGGRDNIPLDVPNTSENYFPFSIYRYLDHSGGLEAYGATAESEEVVRKMILVGLWCIQTMPQNRPSITKVIEMLEGNMDDLEVPPKPNLSFPSFGPTTGISSLHDTCSNDGCSSSVH